MLQAQIAEDFDAGELEVIRAFENAGVQFLIVGGYAVQFHGYRRPRKDLDLLINTSVENKNRLRMALQTLRTDLTSDQFECLSEGRRTKVQVGYHAVEFLTAID